MAPLGPARVSRAAERRAPLAVAAPLSAAPLSAAPDRERDRARTSSMASVHTRRTATTTRQTAAALASSVPLEMAGERHDGERARGSSMPRITKTTPLMMKETNSHTLEETRRMRAWAGVRRSGMAAMTMPAATTARMPETSSSPATR